MTLRNLSDEQRRKIAEEYRALPMDCKGKRRLKDGVQALASRWRLPDTTVVAIARDARNVRG